MPPLIASSSSSWFLLPQLLLIITMGSLLARTGGSYDIRWHLATKTRYAFRASIPGAPSIYSLPDPPGFEPVHLYLLSRHGTRWPTADRMSQVNSLEDLFKDARNTSAYPWLKDWRSPLTRLSFASGELHPFGENELWGLASRLRRRFQGIAMQEYYPKRFPITSTQVPRTAASASAFAAGFFSPPSHSALHVEREDPLEGEAREAALRAGLMEGAGARPEPLSCNMSRPQAVAITMAPKNHDPLLRFYSMCPEYARHDEFTEKWLSTWMLGNWTRLVPGLEQRLGLTRAMDPCEVEALWQLCLVEAGLYNIIDRSCRLFQPEEVGLLEWLDDVHLLESHGYGAPINYNIASPLLADMLQTIKHVAEARHPCESARLMFAHCETLVPLASLMGLFRPQALPPDHYEREEEASIPLEAAQAHLAELDSLEDLPLHVVGHQGAAPGGQQGAAPGGRRAGPPEPRLQTAGSGSSSSSSRRLTSAENDSSSSSSSSDNDSSSPSLTSEDFHMCVNGHLDNSSGALPVPEGWFPAVPYEDGRLWRGSRLAPYGANMALVLYRAKGAQPRLSSHKVRLLYNEQVLPIPGCTPEGRGADGLASLDCDLEQFLELMGGRADPGVLARLCVPGPTGRVKVKKSKWKRR